MNARPRLRPPRPAALALALAATLAASGLGPGLGLAPALAQRTEPLPEGLQGVGVDERPGAALPLQAPFLDANGDTVRLGRYFDGKRPVLLALVYFRCPMLCSLILQGLTDALTEMDWEPGRQYQLVTLSFDPEEGPTLARLKRQESLRKLGRPEAEWHFLTGSPAAIAAVTDSVGFRYRWNEATSEFAHPALITILTPEGHVSRYLYGIQFDPQTIRLSLVEASAGEVGSSLDRFLLYCFHYDSGEGRYAPAARNLMRLGGAAAILALGAVLAILWARERSRRRGTPVGGAV